MKRYTATELKERIDRNDDIIVLDVLGRIEYHYKHLPRAINIPLEELERSAHKILLKSKEIVVYCDTAHCIEAEQAVFQLKTLGYERISILEGGRDSWQQQEFPFEGATIG
jgi:rhodanese-related sulfurtransferase